MTYLSAEQKTVLAALTREGRCTSYFLAKELTDRPSGRIWSSERVGRVMQQLKYRSMVEHVDGVWQPVLEAAE